MGILRVCTNFRHEVDKLLVITKMRMCNGLMSY